MKKVTLNLVSSVRFLILATVGMCVFAGSTSLATERAKEPVLKYLLLPEPQQVNYPPGMYKLNQQQFIFLDTTSSNRLSGIGRIIQQALTLVGTRLELTAAAGHGMDRIGCSVMIDPVAVPKPQGYRLTINHNRINLVAHDPAGAFYGAQTLKQICRQRAAARQLNCVQINDWPDFPNRGVLLDISRDKVPTMKTLYELIDLLSEWKINQFQLYTEHTFAYRNHRVVWEKASPMTGEEIMALDTYCRDRFVELVPNQTSFAHMERWLRLKEYIHLAETRDNPRTLSPAEPGSIELMSELFSELLPHFSSRKFNVNCDETWDLGSGKSKEMCDRMGKGRVYLDFLLQVHQQVKKHGRKMQFWGDIILKHPELIEKLPKDITAMVWGYSAEHPYAQKCPKFAAAGIPFYVCPGTSTWNSIAGRTDNAIRNLENAAENGLRHGATGYLNTDWGDNGHWESLPASYLGYAYGAAASWAMQSNKNLDLPAVLDLHAFRDEAKVMGKLVYDLGNTYREPATVTPRTGRQSTVFQIFYAGDCPIDKWPYEDLTIDFLKKKQSYIDTVILPLSKARMGRQDARQIVDEFSKAARLLRHGCSLAIARLQTEDGKFNSIPGDTRKQLAAELQSIIDEHKRLWLLRNRQGGLVDTQADWKEYSNSTKANSKMVLSKLSRKEGSNYET